MVSTISHRPLIRHSILSMFTNRISHGCTVTHVIYFGGNVVHEWAYSERVSTILFNTKNKLHISKQQCTTLCTSYTVVNGLQDAPKNIVVMHEQ